MPRRRDNQKGPHPIESYVGNRVKSRRLMLGMSQEELAAAIGLTFQQIQKYESGANRIAFSRLCEISHALKVPLEYFTNGMEKLPGADFSAKGFSDGKQEALEPDPLANKDVMELVRAYMRIRKPQLKKQLLEMAKAMSVVNDD